MSNETVGNVTRKNEQLWTYLEAARNAAMVTLESSVYIRQELPNVHIGAALKVEVEALCDHYLGAKHDAMTEINELAELIGEGCSPEVVALRVTRIADWLSEPALKADPLVKALEIKAKRNWRAVSAYILVAESATNVITALKTVWSARDLYLGSDSESVH